MESAVFQARKRSQGRHEPKCRDTAVKGGIASGHRGARHSKKGHRVLRQGCIPLSKRAKEDKRQTDLIRDAWEDSGKIYGYRKLHDDLCDLGETSCPNRVARLASLAGIRAQIGYKRRPGMYGGKPSVAVDNTLDRQFDVDTPDQFWVTDITYIKTYEGF